MSYRHTADFLLYDWLHVESLQSRPRFADHSRETFDSVLDTCERIAREKFAPFNRLADIEEPRFDGERVILPASSHAAAQAITRAERIALEVIAIGRGTGGDVAARSLLAARSGTSCRTSGRRTGSSRTPLSAVRCRAPSAGWRCRW